MDTSKLFWRIVFIIYKDFKISFSLSSAHFWHLNPMLDYKILRESKDKSVYKNKQSICIDMT